MKVPGEGIENMNAPRKKGEYKRATLTIRIPKYLKEQLKLLAKAEGRSVTSYITVAIKTKLRKDEQ